jgi:4-hydroxy-tetrahydrodipicolinate synthase
MARIGAEYTIAPVASGEQLEDVNAVTVTPFAGDEIDLEGVGRNVRHLTDAGVRVVVCGGNTGEFYALAPEELRAVVETTVAAVPPGTLVIAGTGHRTELAIRIGREALEAGAGTVMLHYPVNPGLGAEGLAAYYAEVIAGIGGPVVLYVRGPLLTARVLEAARDAGELVGVKYAVADPAAFARLASSAPDLSWVCGLAERWAPIFWHAGARGFTSGLTCVAPQRALALRDSLRAGDTDLTGRIWRELVPFEELRDRHDRANDVAVVKAALDRIGLAGGPVRPPLSSLSPEDAAELDTILTSWGLL